MFELSPSVETTAASVLAIPAFSSTTRSIPWPTTKPPRHSPSRASAASSSPTQVTSQPSAARLSATCEPVRPHPMTTALIRMRLHVEHRLGERDDEPLAVRVLEHVVDGRREEPRLPPPARRRAHHDEVDAPPRRLLDDRVPDRACVDGVGVHDDAVLLAERACLCE